MESTSASSFMALFAFQETDYFVMLVMTAFLGWRISEVVRHSFKKNSRSKSSKLSKNKPSEEADAVAPQLKYPADSAQTNQKPKRIPPTQTLLTKAAVPTTSGLEQAVAELRAPPGLEPPPGLPLPKVPAVQIMQEASWRKPVAPATPVAPREDNVEKQLGRVVCWKETGYGFIVDEAGERLFVRQAEVEGGEKLRAGQLIWFRRGRAVPGQAAKALSVTIVSQDASKVMRSSAPNGLMSTPKAGNKALAMPTKKEALLVPPPATAPPEQKSSDVGTDDDDLCAFLGAGSKEEQIKNLKYAPQWVADKFWSQQAQQQKK